MGIGLRFAIRLVAHLAAALCLAAAVYGHRVPVRFDHLSIDEGLPDSQIHSIFQDRRGFLWISTRDGLGRYDGYEVQIFRHDPIDRRSVNGSWIGPVMEDRRGRLWVALGVGGFDRLDPRTGVFSHLDLVPESPEMNDFSVTDMVEDAAGSVWIATAWHGLFRVLEDDRIEPFRAAATEGLDSDSLTDLELDADGRLWVATCGGGVSRVEASSTSVPRFSALRGADGLASDCVRGLHASESGGVWLGTPAGVSRLAPDGQMGWLVTSFPRDGEPLGSVALLVEDSGGFLWAGMDGEGLARLDPQRGEWRIYPFAEWQDPSAIFVARGPQSRNSVSFLLSDGPVVWAGAFGSGLYRYDPEADHLDAWHHDPADPRSLSADVVSCGLLDRAGNLWIGTGGKGMSMYSPWRAKFGGLRWDPLRRSGLGHPAVGALAADADHLWIGTAVGLDAFDLDSGDLRPVELGGSWAPPVTALETDEDGALWIGTGTAGLFRFRPRPEGSAVHGELRAFASRAGDPATPSSQNIRVLERGLSPHVLWLGTQQGVIDRVDLRSGEVERAVATLATADGRRSAVWALAEDPAGYLWAGAPSVGLFRLHLETGELRRYGYDPLDFSGLNNRTVNSLHVDRHGRLFVGMFSGGLDLYLPASDSFLHLTTHDGLPSNMVESIVEEPGGALWLATRHELARYDPEKPEIRVYERREGFVVSAFATGAGLRTEDGRFFFGGLDGVVGFRPEDLRSNPHVPEVALTRFRRLSPAGRETQTLDGVEEVVVRPGDRVFDFSFAVLDFQDPGRNRFAYRLDGFDDAWIESANPSATYTNIDPGRYVFRVKGANADGVWSRQEASVRVRVLPPFWRTPWFRALQGLGATLLLAFAFLWQKRRLVAKERRQHEKQELARKTRELTMARQVQRSMLPRRDFVGRRFEAAGRHRTASEVGGDYFDVIETADGRHCVAAGDALGHGMAAGLVVAMVKSGLLSSLRGTEARPADLLSDLDAMLRGLGGGGRQAATMGLTLGLIESDLTLEIASVAMPYPYLWRAAEQRLEILEIGGLPLGRRRPDEKAATVRRHLEPGDLLVLVSDGLAERLGPGQDLWGYERLEETVARLCGTMRSATALAEALLAACDDFAEGIEAPDDMTVLVVRALA